MWKPDGRAWLLGLGILAGCDQAMTEQPKRRPLQPSVFFRDGRSSRPLVEGTVAQGDLHLDDSLYRGRTGEAFISTLPIPLSAELLSRGRERFDIYCSPCHDRTGTGQGMIVQRGYRAPPSLHLDRLRQAPSGQLFDTITRGLGAMPPYAAQIPVRDRWAIVAYVRALQLSRNARIAELTDDERRRLEAGPP
jgi:mono/diheme cytochrome c family protein